MPHEDECSRCRRTVICYNESCPDNGGLCPACQEELDDALLEELEETTNHYVLRHE